MPILVIAAKNKSNTLLTFPTGHGLTPYELFLNNGNGGANSKTSAKYNKVFCGRSKVTVGIKERLK